MSTKVRSLYPVVLGNIIPWPTQKQFCTENEWRLPPAPVPVTGHIHEHGEKPALLDAVLAVDVQRHLEAAGERRELGNLEIKKKLSLN